VGGNHIKGTPKILDIATCTARVRRKLACRSGQLRAIGEPLVERVRDYAQVKAEGFINHAIAIEALGTV